MKIFGRNDAEHKAIERHQEAIISSGVAFAEFSADDEVCNVTNTEWITATDDVVKYVIKCRKSQKSVLTLESVVRLTAFSSLIQLLFRTSLYCWRTLN